jgi:hypothetical protein
MLDRHAGAGQSKFEFLKGFDGMEVSGRGILMFHQRRKGNTESRGSGGDRTGDVIGRSRDPGMTGEAQVATEKQKREQTEITS